MHVRDLNFVLKSEIFIHTDEQLKASHLILGCTPVYKTWQPFNQALSVDIPLLSYIDVWHANFLPPPPSLTTNEARDLGPRYTTVEDLASIRDESAERVSKLLGSKDIFPLKGTQVKYKQPRRKWTRTSNRQKW